MTNIEFKLALRHPKLYVYKVGRATCSVCVVLRIPIFFRFLVHLILHSWIALASAFALPASKASNLLNGIQAHALGRWVGALGGSKAGFRLQDGKTTSLRFRMLQVFWVIRGFGI